MTIKPRVVRALKDARTRLRDVAAAAHSTAVASAERTGEFLAQEEDTLEVALDAAPASLAAARTVYDLEDVGEDTGVYRIAVADAAAKHASAVKHTETTASQLQVRARQLRVAERLVERVETHHARREASAEQRGSDDLAARRR